MKKSRLEIFCLVFLVISMIFISYYFLIRPLTFEEKKIEVNASNQKTLTLMTEAFLRQNDTYLNFGKFLKNYSFGNTGSEYKIAAQYYYLTNPDNFVNDDELYDKILETAKELFDRSNLAFKNFEINLDDCGQKKFSSIEGIIVNDDCDSNNTIYEIGNIYKQGEFYIVEFYASQVEQSSVDSTKKCSEFEKSKAFKLNLATLDGTVFYDKTNEYCCSSDEKCAARNINDNKEEIINQTKINKSAYKIKYKLVKEKFIYYELQNKQ